MPPGRACAAVVGWRSAGERLAPLRELLLEPPERRELPPGLKEPLVAPWPAVSDRRP